MSKWYAAHLVIFVQLKDQAPGRCTAWENIVLIKAESEDEAFEKAERRGKEEAGDDDGTFRWNGKPARWVFAGVRKLTSCEDPDRRPGDGTEVSYVEMRLESEQSVYKLVQGDPVKVQIADRFADAASNGGR
jgi:hypothetical protein